MKSISASSLGGLSITSMPSSAALAAMIGEDEPVISRIGMTAPSVRSLPGQFQAGHIRHVMVQDQAGKMPHVGQ